MLCDWRASCGKSGTPAAVITRLPLCASGSSSRAEEQLAAIASLSRALDHQSIDYWLFGGWAVDSGSVG